jgi:nicotinate phosphoribosyltransferase
MNQIITSLLETDLYKFNMGNVIFKKFNNYHNKWTFKCRNTDVYFTNEMVEEIKRQFDLYCTLRFNTDELTWLQKNHPWLSEGYINYLKFWHPIRTEVTINTNHECGLNIEAEGTWLNTSMYEIVLLAIVNEVYFTYKYNISELETEFKKRTNEKLYNLSCGKYQLGKFSEFGLRRRLSKNTQDWLIQELIKLDKQHGFIGTSNVYLAYKYNIKSCGTMAHEFGMNLMSDQRYNVAYTNERIMKVWTDEYGVKNGIYLTDLLGRDAFLADFDEKYATLFSGVRHDSGDPIEWGEMIINHYKKLNIDPKTKTLLFSDGLTFENATNIFNHFKTNSNVAFGIGTHLTNDTNVPALNIVMKVTESNGLPVCKLTDNPDKAMGNDKNFIDFVKRAINWRLNKN